MVAKVNNIDISGFALKTICDTDKSDLEIKICDADKKIPNISELVKRTDYNVTITEIASKISSITGLATTAALTVVKIKYLMLVMSKKKADYHADILDNKSKYFTTVDNNKFTNENLDLKTKQKILVSKSDITGLVKNAD